MVLRIVHTVHDFAEEGLGHLSPVIQTYVVCVVIYLLDRLQVARFLAMVYTKGVVVLGTTRASTNTSTYTSTDSSTNTTATCTAAPTPTGIVSNDLSVFHFIGRWRSNETLLMLISNARQGRIFQIYIIFVLIILVWIIESAAKVGTQLQILPLGLRPTNRITLQCTLKFISNHFIFRDLIRLTFLIILHILLLCCACLGR